VPASPEVIVAAAQNEERSGLPGKSEAEPS
jgi:hypothetical protein